MRCTLKVSSLFTSVLGGGALDFVIPSHVYIISMEKRWCWGKGLFDSLLGGVPGGQ